MVFICTLCALHTYTVWHCTRRYAVFLRSISFLLSRVDLVRFMRFSHSFRHSNLQMYEWILADGTYARKERQALTTKQTLHSFNVYTYQWLHFIPREERKNKQEKKTVQHISSTYRTDRMLNVHEREKGTSPEAANTDAYASHVQQRIHQCDPHSLRCKMLASRCSWRDREKQQKKRVVRMRIAVRSTDGKKSSWFVQNHSIPHKKIMSFAKLITLCTLLRRHFDMCTRVWVWTSCACVHNTCKRSRWCCLHLYFCCSTACVSNFNG